MVFKAQVSGSQGSPRKAATVFPCCATTDLCMYHVLPITCHGIETKLTLLDVVETHCYDVDIERTDCEQIRSRINNNWCRIFWPHRPLSTVYKTLLFSWVLYAVDKGLCGRNVVHHLLLILLHICSQSVCPLTLLVCISSLVFYCNAL